MLSILERTAPFNVCASARFADKTVEALFLTCIHGILDDDVIVT